MVKKAVIIAAGRGSRLNNGADLPKPLVPVAGVGLLKRTILTARRAGVSEFVIVTGYRGQEIRDAISADPQVDAPIVWVENKEWERANGVSVLKAREHVDEPFLLMMADHVFDPRILVKMRRQPVAQGEAVLGVDRQLDGIYDMDDATKVALDGDHIVRIGKELSSYTAVDVGVFVCSPGLFDALALSIASGEDSLSGGIRKLAEAGRMRAVDVEGLFWQDVDTPEALVHAEEMLFKMLVKPTDGFVSRHFNRKISTRISRLLVRTPVTPNQISIATMCLTFLAGWCIASGEYLWLALGGVLFQLASVVDGCDGEIAKLKFMGSRMGEWVDTLADNVSYGVFFGSVTYGMYRMTGELYVLTLGWAVMAMVILGVSLIYLYLQNAGSGSIVSFSTAFSEEVPEERRDWFYHVCCATRFACRRDFFAALFASLALADCLACIFWIFAIGGGLFSVGIFAYVGYMLRNRGVWPARGAQAQPAEKFVSEKAD